MCKGIREEVNTLFNLCTQHHAILALNYRSSLKPIPTKKASWTHTKDFRGIFEFLIQVCNSKLTTFQKSCFVVYNSSTTAFFAPAARTAARMTMNTKVGVSAPLGFFDPFGFSKKASPETMAKYRDSELKHGRVAMIAVLGVLAVSSYEVVFNRSLSWNWRPPASFTPLVFLKKKKLIYIMKIQAEKWHPLYDGAFSGNPITALYQVPQLGIVL